MAELARTPSGKLVLCDGCTATILADYDVDTQVWPLDPAVGLAAYGTAALVYIVCPPVRGQYSCLTLARLSDELFLRTRCEAAGCAGECEQHWSPVDG